MSTEEKLKSMIPKYEHGREIKPVYDVANSVIHYQTDPYIDEDGTVKVKRVATFPVVVEKAFHIVEEYEVTKKY